MMQAAENWLGPDVAHLSRLVKPSLWTVLLQPQMSPTPMVVLQVFLEHSFEVPPIEDDHVIQASRRIEPITLSTYGFCQGDRFAVRTCLMPIADNRRVKSKP